MGCIGRSVIPNEKLGRKKILLANTGELVSKVSIPVVGRHYDRDASALSHGTIIREDGVEVASNIWCVLQRTLGILHQVPLDDFAPNHASVQAGGSYK